MWADLHEAAFRAFGGCCRDAVLDNLEEGVLRPDLYAPRLHPVYAAMLAHYGVVADPCCVRERKVLKDFDWTYNTRLPKREVLALGTLQFLDANEDLLLIGSPGTGKSHCANALTQLAVQRGYKVLYREAH